METRYSPQSVEEKWYQHWEKSGYFHSTPDERPSFTIVIPPPNVTGVLHMGHILNNTIQDVLTRHARMTGFNACWVPGTDHASIATEAKVVRWLREDMGLTKGEVGRDKFIEYAWQWTEKYGGIILTQLRKLGCSCDWERTAFTMDDTRYPMVIDTFIDLYQKGKLYRGKRMVNWDPEAKTVLSNEEVIYGQEQSKLHYVRYAVEGAPDEYLTIATTRPETILGDTALAVQPEDERYKKLHGKRVLVPLIGRSVPIITDAYVDREFGTGALKITPAHDPNDYDIGLRHKLEIVDVLNDDGTMSDAAQLYIGMDRFAARKAIVLALEEAGHLVKIEDYTNNVGRSERTNAIIEPKLSQQWYVDMPAIAKPALDAVMSDTIRFFPENMKNTYRHWMENIRDWCISRQLWWGHRIPAYYLISPKAGEEDLVFVAASIESALDQAQTATGRTLTPTDLRQDEDVLDTWFSSWLWPFSVFGGPEMEKELAYYYPTSVLVTGWDIIFLWVARMIMAGYEYRGAYPFKDVYFTGMVRDKQRRKMSKSLGNSPDALKLIEDFGADGVRFGILASSPAGGDLLFDDKLCEQGRNFCNKIWNACRLVKGWEADDHAATPLANHFAMEWFESRTREVVRDVTANIKQYRLSEALMSLYTYVWNDFCSWYLEMIKPTAGQGLDAQTYATTIRNFETILTLLHPFMPFITEELWHQLGDRAPGGECMMQDYPEPQEFDTVLLKQGVFLTDLVGKIRDERNKASIKMKEVLPLQVDSKEGVAAHWHRTGFMELLSKMANLSGVQQVSEAPGQGLQFIHGTETFYIPVEVQKDTAEERAQIEKDLAHARNFVKGIEAKLRNERFMANAPEAVVANEQKKLADGKARLQMLEEALRKL